MTDGFGTRIAIIAAFESETDQPLYCIDVDVCAHPEIVAAGDFDTLEDAASSWRSVVGDTAADSVPGKVTDLAWLSGVLGCAASHLDDVADREISDRVEALIQSWRAAGVQPKQDEPLSLADISRIVDVFMKWHRGRYRTTGDVSAVLALAWHWHAVTVRGTWGRVSPHRAAHLRDLIHEWDHSEMVRAAALKLLPRWIVFLGECGKLPQPLLQAAVDAAATDACPEDCTCQPDG